MSLSNIQKLLLAFVTLMLGVVLVGVIATNTIAVTAKTIVYDESDGLATAGCIASVSQQVNESNSACNITLTNVPSGWKTEDCPLTSVTVFNTSAETYSALTEGTDYNAFLTTGVIQMLNTTDTDEGDVNTTYTNYVYCSNDYMNLPWGRTVLNLIAGFFAIALLLTSVGLFYDVAKESGIINR